MTTNPIKVYTVVSKEVKEDPDLFTNLEGVFSTYEKAQEYIDHFFGNAKYGYRSIVTTYLDPFQKEIQNNDSYYSISSQLMGPHLEVEICKTSFAVVLSELEQLRIDPATSEKPLELNLHCFAASEEKAMEKFAKLVQDYAKEHKLQFQISPFRIADSDQCY
ncbi:hypothetical protein BCY89_09005 [Sphingobacterium siyangense]|jgi:hypothetical protein|uniref:Uncharacterized protein n=1 Tax=Sphingobacterium siyangense TaxID=459529 RepID=A0A420FQ62_9SPHI|nr:hypothetical protein [Sphingobacterium siyangense]QRY56766.1 hypothetical protein JVX97_22555 [Sphingobacterium siyangense]RKF35074.1 hypothetical protein BCY89_09005 [Sphingobacterium siyangense]